ncbi:MAG TPA: ligase-associated DNA damage response endonuclease PdeM [Alphaproteobacteria bacterium]|nr:ligase-associated DNA damage response endonuclease PdeM [Alphaproteobacteria bacterium]
MSGNVATARVAVGAEEAATVFLRFAGEVFEALPSGALHWPAQRTLLVADLHLEKLASYAKRGALLPPYDTAMTLRRLHDDLERTGAVEVLALGDSFHRDEGTASLLEADRLRLAALMGKARWTWIAGNHDPSPHALGGACVTRLERQGLRFEHQPRRGAAALVAGHLHPAARVAADGRSVRRPCFVHDGRTLILPAYGSSTGSINILSAPFLGVLDHGAIEVAMIGRGRVYPVSPRRLVPG